MTKNTAGTACLRWQSIRSIRSVIGALVVMLAGITHGTRAHAQPADEELSVQQFLSRIDGKLPEFELYEGAIAEAQAEAQEARSLAPVALSYEREEVFIGGQGLPLKNGLSLGWSLDISGRRGQQIKSAERQVEAVRASSTYQEQQVMLAALKKYKRAARARLDVESLQDTREVLAALVNRFRSRVREGDASGLELARFELQLSEHDALLAEAITERAIAQTELAALLGVRGKQIIASDDLELAPLPIQSERPSGVGRADLLATEYEEDSGKALIEAGSRWWIPTLDLSVGYLNTDFGLGTGPGANVAHGYTGMVSAVVPVFSRGKAEKMRGQALIRQARAKRQILDRRIHSGAQRALLLMQSKLAQAHAFKEGQLVQVASLVQQTETAYLGGEASVFELRDAYAKASEARLRFIELRYQYSLAEIALWSATGSLGDSGLR